jgi:hypothetical protein
MSSAYKAGLRKVRLELKSAGCAAVCRCNLFFLREATALLRRPFSRLNQAQPDFLGQPPTVIKSRSLGT